MKKPPFALFLLAFCVFMFEAPHANAEVTSSDGGVSSYPTPLSPQMAPPAVNAVQPDLPPSQSGYQSGYQADHSNYRGNAPSMAQEPMPQTATPPVVTTPQREKTFGEKFEDQRKIWWQNMKRWADVKPDPRQ